jgi:hypothetical protein
MEEVMVKVEVKGVEELEVEVDVSSSDSIGK